MPEEVNKDFETWLKESQIVRMDTKGSQNTSKGVYTIKHGEDSFVFNGVEMAPPSGFFRRNYARFVKNG